VESFGSTTGISSVLSSVMRRKAVCRLSSGGTESTGSPKAGDDSNQGTTNGDEPNPRSQPEGSQSIEYRVQPGEGSTKSQGSRTFRWFHGSSAVTGVKQSGQRFLNPGRLDLLLIDCVDDAHSSQLRGTRPGHLPRLKHLSGGDVVHPALVVPLTVGNCLSGSGRHETRLAHHTSERDNGG
jgi:hypothetical protein